jgi:zinc protease
MLQEGTATRSSERIADEFEFIGSQLGMVTGRELVLLATETMTQHWPTTLELVADLAQNASFPERELARIRRERLTALRRLRDDPTALADRVSPMLLYGPQSPYGHPAFGTEAALEAATRGDLLRQFQGCFDPVDATLLVVGDVSPDEAVRQAETRFGGWRTRGPKEQGPAAAAPESPAPASTVLYLLDKPGAPQSVIRAGHRGAPRHHRDFHALALLNSIFGGQFTARLNMNLRQAKGYSYGYRSWIEWHTESSLLMAGGSVQTASTQASVLETLREFRDLRGRRPVTEAEFTAARDAILRQFPAAFETPQQVLEQLTQLVAFDLPDDYLTAFPARIQALTLAQVQRAAAEHVDAERLTVLVVGDAGTVEPGLKELGLPLLRVDHEGQRV